MQWEPDFQIAHLGINLRTAEEAGECADIVEELFGLKRNPEKESEGSVYTEDKLEWMKKPGKGTHGHIALATHDLPTAMKYLEDKGFFFDENTIKKFPDGRIQVISSASEIGGFAIQLLQI